MKWNNYIALLLLAAFLVKVTTVDGQWLISTLTGDEYAIVNPFCKNKNGSGTTDQTSLIKMDKESTITMDGICSVQLYLDHTSEKGYIYPIISGIKSFLSLPEYETFRQTHYPPPKA